MLENKRETVSLTADSVVEDEVVANFHASISHTGISNGVNLTIRNKDLYDANKSVVREDQQEFQQLVWLTEDRLTATE